MLLLIVAGFVFLLFGRAQVSRNLSLRGKYARLFGLTLLIGAVPLARLVGVLATTLLPSSVLNNEILVMILNLILLIIIALGLAYPFKLWQDRSTETQAPDKKRSTLKWVLIGYGSIILLNHWSCPVRRWRRSCCQVGR